MSIKTNGYRVSANHVVYFNSEKILGVDSLSFVKLSEIWAKDRKHVYCVGRRISKADVSSFQVLNPLYAKDANRCYYLGGIVKEADPDSFQVLDDGECVREYHNGFGDHVHTERSAAGFAADATHVFHYVHTIGKPCILSKADRASFQVLGCGYARDQQNVYFEKSRLKGADSRSFEVVPPMWGRDRKAVFYAATRLAGADPLTFTVLSSRDYLSADASHYYDHQEEIQR